MTIQALIPCIRKKFRSPDRQIPSSPFIETEKCDQVLQPVGPEWPPMTHSLTATWCLKKHGKVAMYGDFGSYLSTYVLTFVHEVCALSFVSGTFPEHSIGFGLIF